MNHPFSSLPVSTSSTAIRRYVVAVVTAARAGEPRAGIPNAHLHASVGIRVHVLQRISPRAASVFAVAAGAALRIPSASSGHRLHLSACQIIINIIIVQILKNNNNN